MFYPGNYGFIPHTLSGDGDPVDVIVVVPSPVVAGAAMALSSVSVVTNALLLNIALIIFGWRRYRELTGEVAERRKAEQHARFLAEADPLTGCLNRRSVTDAADRLIAETSQRGEAMAFIMIDLDRFKQINDSRGHSAGDRMLIETARRLDASLPGNALVARVGGDEFACIVPFDPARPGQIDRLVDGLISEISRTVNHDDGELETTISAGIYHRDPNSEETTQAALHQADIAMYHAKKRGRNRYCWFDPAMESELKFRSELESGIRCGLTAGEFVPFYQKQIDLETGELVGFEMLARWRSEKLGMVSPEIFIPVAEEIGLIAPISESLIRQAQAVAEDYCRVPFSDEAPEPVRLAVLLFGGLVVARRLVGDEKD